MAQARAAINTLLQVGNGGSPETFSTIANVSSINGPSYNVNVVDVTSHSNTFPWREKVATLLDAGEASFDLFFDPSESTHGEADIGIFSLFFNRQKNRWKIQFPAPNAASYFICYGYVTNFALSFSVDGVITASVTITFTGVPETNLA